MTKKNKNWETILGVGVIIILCLFITLNQYNKNNTLNTNIKSVENKEPLNKIDFPDSYEMNSQVISGSNKTVTNYLNKTTRYTISGINHNIYIYNCEYLDNLVVSGNNIQIYLDSKICNPDILNSGINNNILYLDR